MTFFDDNKGGARGSDPRTSHDAAKLVNKEAKERIVRHALRDHGPMTMEEVSDYAGMSINTLGPRFAPLRRKNHIRKSRFTDGSVIKRPGASGSDREVHEYQPDKTLWLENDPGGYEERRRENFNAGIDAAIEEVRRWDDTDEIVEDIRKLKI